MKQPEDALGRRLEVGQSISYVTRKYSRMTLHLAQIVELTWDSSYKDDPWSIKVIAAGKRFKWIPKERTFNRDPYAYKRTLTSNTTIVILDRLPEKTQELIDTYLNERYFTQDNV